MVPQGERRIIFVGETNPYGDPAWALFPWPQASAGWWLPRRLELDEDDYIHSFDHCNLLQVERWSAPQARAAAADLLGRRRAGTGLVLLGVKVAAAFGLPTTPMLRHVRDGRQILTMPHPSGLCRLWQKHEVRSAARSAFAVFRRDLLVPVAVQRAESA